MTLRSLIAIGLRASCVSFIKSSNVPNLVITFPLLVDCHIQLCVVADASALADVAALYQLTAEYFCAEVLELQMCRQ